MKFFHCIKYVCVLTLTLLTGVPTLQADEVQYLTLIVNGNPVRFALSDHPVITFQNNQLIVTTPEETVTVPVAEISIGGFADDLTGIYQLEAAPKGVRGGQVHFNGLRAGSMVSVYTTEGKMVMQQAAKNDGTVTVDLKPLAKGLYVVKSPTQTIKVTNR